MSPNSRQSPMVVICPKCQKVLEIDPDLRHYIESVRRLGCDDCLRKMAYGEGKVAA